MEFASPVHLRVLGHACCIGSDTRDSLKGRKESFNRVVGRFWKGADGVERRLHFHGAMHLVMVRQDALFWSISARGLARGKQYSYLEEGSQLLKKVQVRPKRFPCLERKQWMGCECQDYWHRNARSNYLQLWGIKRVQPSCERQAQLNPVVFMRGAHSADILTSANTK